MTPHVIAAMLCFAAAAMFFAWMIASIIYEEQMRRKVRLSYLIGYNKGARDQYNSSVKLWEQ